MAGRSKKRTPAESATLYGRAAGPEESRPSRAVTEAGARDTDTSFEPGLGDILDSLPFYALLVDEDHYILQANNAVLTQLGMTPGEVVGRYCPKVVHGIDGPFHGCPLEEALEKDEGVGREVFDEHSERWLRSAIYPTAALTPEGKKVLFHMVTDITDQKPAEAQLRVAHERLRSLSTHLESVREEERRKLARDLHDETSQDLTSLSAHLEAVAQTLPANAGKSRALLRTAQDLSVRVLDEMSGLIYELRPAQLDDLGLAGC